MSVLSTIDQINNTGNLDVYIDNEIVSSFLLNVGHEGIELSELSRPAVISLPDLISNLDFVRSWTNACELIFSIPKYVPNDLSYTITQSLTRNVADNIIDGWQFGFSYETSDELVTVGARAATFLPWGSFYFFQNYYQYFISSIRNRNIVPDLTFR